MYKAPQIPQIAELTYSGTPTSIFYTYTFSVDQQTENFLSVSSSTNIDLPSGHYYAIAYPDYTRASGNVNNSVYWYVNGSQVGKIGGSDHFSNFSTDNAEATFTLTSTGVLTLRQTDWSGTALTLTSNSRAYIFRVPL
jgi:hypothetical protein